MARFYETPAYQLPDDQGALLYHIDLVISRKTKKDGEVRKWAR